MRIFEELTAWFPVEGDPDGAKAKIKHLTPGEIQTISDQVNLIEREYRRGEDGEERLVAVSRYKEGLDQSLTARACVVEWEGFKGADGQALPCTPEHVARLLATNEDFWPFVSRCRAELRKRHLERKAALAKNSVTSPSGSPA